MKRNEGIIEELYIDFGNKGNIKGIKGTCLAKNIGKQFNKLKELLGLGGSK